jgi:serine/threonine-protein kinase
VTVPDVSGVVEAKAKKQLEQLGLKVSVATAADDLPAGVVVRSSPDAGAAVDPGSTVRITVSQGRVAATPQQTTAQIMLKDYSGVALQAATDDLQRQGVSVAVAYQATRLQPSGYVVQTQPAAGSYLAPGGRVTLIVAR